MGAERSLLFSSYYFYSLFVFLIQALSERCVVLLALLLGYSQMAVVRLEGINAATVPCWAV